MDNDDYESLVRRLESESEQNPASFRRKVVFISIAAYLALAGLLAILIGIVWFGLSHYREVRNAWLLLKLGALGFAVLGMLFVILRAFLTRLEPPVGREVTATDAPKLFDLLDRLRAKLGGPPIDRVVVDQTFNAAISQVPRFGLFGGHRNHLILGLPYLYAMTPKEMLATLAHEYGHLAGDHGKLGAWVYRQRITFGALYEKLRANAESNWINGLISSALDRFAPHYNAYTFVLSRQQEYEADAIASRITSSEANASGLIRGELLGRWMQETFWPKFYAQAVDRPQPLFFPFSAMRTAFPAGSPEWSTLERLRDAEKIDSGLNDTHPCLRDRVNAIGLPIALPKPVEQNAADALLGPLAPRLAKEFDAQWWQEHQTRWQSYHHKRQEGKRRIAELGGRAAETLNPYELQELAQLLIDDERPADAKPVLEELLRRPGGPFPKANWLCANLLLDDGNVLGLDHLRQAAEADASLAGDCARRGYYYLLSTKGEDAADAWVETLPNLP